LIPISRQLIRIWVGKFEAGALDEDVQAADLSGNAARSAPALSTSVFGASSSTLLWWRELATRSSNPL